MKKCPKCGDQFEEDVNFCPKDGTKLVELEQSDTAMISGSTVMAGGDVNISKTVNQSITNIVPEDESRKLVTCAVSGKEDVITNGQSCESCKKWIHESNLNNKICVNCHDSHLLEYKKLFKSLIDNEGKIDNEERGILDEKLRTLCLDGKLIEDVESELRNQHFDSSMNSRSDEENRQIQDAKELLFKRCDFLKAHNKFKILEQSLPKDDEVFKLYITSGLARDLKRSAKFYVDKIKERIRSQKVDDAELLFLLILALELSHEKASMYSKLKHGLMIFPDDLNLQLKNLELAVDEFFSNQDDASSHLEKAKKIHEKLVIPNDKNEYANFVLRYFSYATNSSHKAFYHEEFNGSYYWRLKKDIHDAIRKPLSLQQDKEQKQREDDKDAFRGALILLLILLIVAWFMGWLDFITDEKESSSNSQSFSKPTSPYASKENQNPATEGKGITFRDGIYSGALVNSIPHGFGMWEHMYSDEKYEGQFKEGVRHGSGKVWYNKGGFFEGQFKDGTRFKGIYKFKDGKKFEGECNSLGKWHGNGKFYWPDGRRYEGQFVNDSITGKGKLYFPNGNSFTGDFRNYVPNGSGVFRWNDGGRYEGTVVNNFKSGKGVFISGGKSTDVRWENREMKKKGGFLGNLIGTPLRILSGN